MNLVQPFAIGQSWLHRLEPRVKCVSAACLVLVLATLTRFPAAWAGLGFAVALTGSARLSLAKLGSRLILANVFVAFLWLVLPWTVPGKVVYQSGIFAITEEGLRRALIITIKCNAILLVFVALPGTSRLSELGHALRQLGCPAKLVLVFVFAVRYLDAIALEFHRLREAIRVRGFHPRTDLHTYRTYANLLGVLFVRSHDRAERIYQAMECRGFRGRFPSYVKSQASAADGLAAAGFFLVAALLLSFQWLP